MSMKPDAKIFVAGHRGLVGGAILRRLRASGFTNLLTRSLGQLDLRDQAAVARFFRREQPEYVFLAARRVGGIHANSTYPAQFIYDNLIIEANVIHQAYVNGVTTSAGGPDALRRTACSAVFPSRPKGIFPIET